MGKVSKRNGRVWGDGVRRGSEGSAPPSRCGQLCHLPLPAGNPGGFVTATLLSSSLTDNHLLPRHVVRLHTRCVFKLHGVGGSLRGVSAAPPMSKMLPRMSDLEPPCPLLQPKSRGAREGCPGMGCWYQLQAAGPHAGAPAGEQQHQCDYGTLRQCPALKFQQQSKAKVVFISCSRSLPPSFSSKRRSSASATGMSARPGAAAAHQVQSHGVASEASAEFTGV